MSLGNLRPHDSEKFRWTVILPSDKTKFIGVNKNHLRVYSQKVSLCQLGESNFVAFWLRPLLEAC